MRTEAIMSRTEENEPVDLRFTADIPTVPFNSPRCFYNSERGGKCRKFDLEFDTREEWREHRRRCHPTACSHMRCRNVASYTTAPGLSSTHYCIEHAPANPENCYRYQRANQEANAEIPTLPDNHPIETALSGLELESNPITESK